MGVRFPPPALCGRLRRPFHGGSVSLARSPDSTRTGSHTSRCQSIPSGPGLLAHVTAPHPGSLCRPSGGRSSATEASPPALQQPPEHLQLGLLTVRRPSGGSPSEGDPGRGALPVEQSESHLRMQLLEGRAGGSPWPWSGRRRRQSSLRAFAHSGKPCPASPKRSCCQLTSPAPCAGVHSS